MEKFLNILFKVWWIGGLIFLTVMLLKNKPVEENAFSHCWNCGTGIYLSDEECNQCSWRICSACGACEAYGSCRAYQERRYQTSNEPKSFEDYIMLFFVGFPIFLFLGAFIFEPIINCIKSILKKWEQDIKLEELQLEKERQYEENLKRQQKEELKKQEELKRQQEEELKKQEELKRQQEERIIRNQNGIFEVGDFLYDENNNQFIVKGIDNDKILVEGLETKVLKWKMSGEIVKSETKLVVKPYTVEEIKKIFIIK